MGLVRSRHVHSGERHTGWRSYRWDVGARLMSMRCNLSPEPVIFDYDGMCNLVRADYSMHESIFRTPDKVGNLYRSESRRDRTYDGGGRLTSDGEFHYRYDCEGNLVHRSRRNLSDMSSGSAGRIRKGLFGLFSSPENGEGGSTGSKDTPFADWQPGDTCYEWLASGMLAGVKTPDGKTVYFGYDALGRRVSKTVDGTVRRFGWDGNVVLHEWDIEEADRPKFITDESGREEYEGTENPENLVTWIYDGTSFTPVAKVTDRERYTIVHDYLGTPTQAYDSRGNLVWEMLLDVYGEVKECHGDRTLVPFRYQGQYEDKETGLYYNRFRYYSPQMGMYISSDPIGLSGNNPTLYGYVEDVNIWLDIEGLNKASWWLHDPEGKLIDSGTMRPDPKAKTIPQRTGDSEQKILKIIETKYAGNLEGTKLTINSEPTFIKTPTGKTVKIEGIKPCDFCDARMDEFAIKNKMKIEYNYRGKKVCYPKVCS
ncbi:RHS repeat domain-containing protein [Phocaeicola vulgatus]|uniref:RHS repeat domain-containing protein n=1 Tax=Phocaeicola vulgatus TaxID=821 RepID=UPI001EDE2B63|nr:RHS repeat-associated core domain-containing protein [Phocaeicola vulgatus]MCG4727459.1 hypothetical protein [Phocaeicola vulgatus]